MTQGGPYLPPTITYLRIRVCVCAYTCWFFVTFPHFECERGYNRFDPKKIHRFLRNQKSWSNFRVASGVRKIIDHQFFPPYYRLIIDFLTLYRPILSIFLFSGYLARLCTQPSEDFKNRLIGLTLTMYFKYCSLGKLEILKSWKYKRLSTKYKGLSTKLSWNLENIKDYRLNYRLFGKLSTI